MLCFIQISLKCVPNGPINNKRVLAQIKKTLGAEYATSHHGYESHQLWQIYVFYLFIYLFIYLLFIYSFIYLFLVQHFYVEFNVEALQ